MHRNRLESLEQVMMSRRPVVLLFFFMVCFSCVHPSGNLLRQMFLTHISRCDICSGKVRLKTSKCNSYFPAAFKVYLPLTEKETASQETNVRTHRDPQEVSWISWNPTNFGFVTRSQVIITTEELIVLPLYLRKRERGKFPSEQNTSKTTRSSILCNL